MPEKMAVVGNLRIWVDFYRPSGKWYAGGEVDLGNARMWGPGNEFKQAIVDNQQALKDGWQGDYIVVTSDLPVSWADPNYHEFNKRVYMPEAFIGITRKENKTND